MIVTKDGFIFVAIPKKDVALKALNTIMTIGTLRNLDLFAVREHELSETGYNKETMQLGGYTFSLSTMRSLLFEERYGQRILPYERREVSEQTLRGIIKEASDIFKEEKYIEELELLGEAFTHFNDAEYAQSFVMSWIIIERHVSELWRRRLDSKNFDHERMSKLLNPSQWSIDYLLEVLNMNGEINETEYDIFMEMKNKRNKFIHQGKQIAKEDAERCLNIAKEIVMKKLGL